MASIPPTAMDLQAWSMCQVCNCCRENKFCVDAESSHDKYGTSPKNDMKSVGYGDWNQDPKT